MTCKSTPARQLDACGLRCPLPLLRTKQALAGMQSGETLEVLATDAGSWRDIPAYLSRAPHQLLEQDESEAGLFRFLIQRGED
ncbi:sulfurtransferase TusA family protein [Saccharospirillum impatiens]|uniref:sulfurtransferase TusA family protein n=1 Tax=Saccharospirillum impatiens TaxID=169438 RepID=UPI00048AFB58|nr:sulfurtransferase TusA family protein [Saccharospirillum impatiens]